jgi:hypothetical protein
MTVAGIKCEYCDGTGERTFCHNNCKPGDRWVSVDDATGKMGCGDCLDECSWCHGFGVRYPAGTVMWPDDIELFGMRGDPQ